VDYHLVQVLKKRIAADIAMSWGSISMNDGLLSEEAV
jgi:hypothetical protein